MSSSNDDKPNNPGPPAGEDATQFAPPRRKPEPEADEKTRFRAPAPGKKTGAGSAVEPAQAEDKTRFKPSPGSGQAPGGTPSPGADEKTQFRAPRPKTSASEQAERTRFKPSAGEQESRTRIAPAKPQAAPAGAPAPQGAAPSSQAQTKTDPGNADSDDVPHILKRRFVLEEVLGMGGMGIVYKARDLLKVEARDRDPYVAIKVLSDEFKSHPEAFVALQRESRKTQRIAHPNIVNVHDFDRDGDMVFMTMEFLDGKPLDKLIKQYRSTGLPSEEAWQIVKDISAALVYAHKEKIIHSDFKPGNIFVTKRGMAKVFDFGIARAVSKAEAFADAEGGHEGDRTVFDAGELGALTPAYASFEMLGGEEPDIRDDVYALACVVYEVFTGEHPFNKMRADRAFAKKLKPKRINALSKHQWKVLEKALAFQREDRIESVEQFLREITRVRKTPYITISAFSLLLAGGAAGYFQLAQQPQGPTAEEVAAREALAQEAGEEAGIIKAKKDDIKRLLDAPSLTREWETLLLADIDYLRKYLDPQDPWLKQTEEAVFKLYNEKIKQLREERKLTEALEFLERAGNLRIRETEFVAEAEGIKQQLEDERKKQQDLIAQQQAEIKAQQHQAAVASAVANLKTQLGCKVVSGRQTWGIDTAKLDAAISRLKKLSSATYNKHAPEYAKMMATCIKNVAIDDPERATKLKQQGTRLFADQRASIAGIKIIPKDPCSASLAGAGGRNPRSVCKDPLASGGSGPKLVVIPKGRGHEIFAIGKYEVSVAEFNQFCKRNRACSPLSGDKSLPATGISADLAKRYVAWLSKETDRDYRIPSQREWEYAAKAKTGKLDPNRNCTLVLPNIKRGDSLVSVRSGQSNNWGLVNHVGNAQEWVLTSTSRLMAAGGARTDPLKECTEKTVRRHSGKADAVTGFRVARSVTLRK